jgi:hypothetical protein
LRLLWWFGSPRSCCRCSSLSAWRIWTRKVRWRIRSALLARLRTVVAITRSSRRTTSCVRIAVSGR